MMKSCKANLKSNVFLKYERVLLPDVVSFCPGLDAPDAHRQTGSGTIIREALLDLQVFRQFHHWSEAGYGLGLVDKRGDAWFVVGASIVHLDPGATSINAPSMKLIVEVLFSCLFVCFVNLFTVCVCVP
jgi:hypothetical protein